jgi:CsoR family transcriptional regulator, copper-sensing transcriptional repressor
MINCCNCPNLNHSKETANLNRVIGQLEGIKRMIGDNRYCMDILTQCEAAKSAIKAIERNILEQHLSSCIVKAFEEDKDKQTKIKEILDFFKKID